MSSSDPKFLKILPCGVCQEKRFDHNFLRLLNFSLIVLQRLFFVIPVKTGIQDVYGPQKLNWIPAFAGMTDRAVALFVGTVPFFLKESP